MSEHYIGLMSGTSMDGVDGVLAAFDSRIQVLEHCHQPFDDTLRAELLALNSPGANELHRGALAANAIARAYAAVTAKLLQRSQFRPDQITAIGAHGQTVRHRPGAVDGVGYTLQLLNGSLLAELGGIDVVCDLRSRDLAAGGQGAPLVPAFHRALFGRPEQSVAVLNVGGISNISLLCADGSTTGFDTGPGNCLMDLWALRHLGQAYDAGGAWAAGGQVLPELLTALLAEPFFASPPPRSTGRDLFNAAWLDTHLSRHAAAASPQDVQTTLLELSAACASQALQAYAPEAIELLVCGGGVFNSTLMDRLQARLPTLQVLSTDQRGLPAMQVEAAAFAWLARQFNLRAPGNLPQVTGATGPRVLGALYPAGQ
ncbi:anhydro-N-acetylmuramic acid kinase [Roseateles toxinivorans]|uniref:Anhydro-N-acetylmuramic acid kinase n=1 Tax=Roseateles toxinivorans TaxID=270368 RepID=A0A4R6QKZ5_9BURK|nr:anhydro-N-acetylmuramic acid kinase [Roseateles toxinivorans]TDP62722.1 anhydro-N-acetylmuramic acid kinase [Roseateles toxinivorans]